ncbi:hypothetical protein MBLNU13_g09992t1 [Cladosporium sp. NU13]
MDKVEERSMVDRMRSCVSSLLEANSGSSTPSSSISSSRFAQGTALLCDVATFAQFTESVTRKRNIAALCTPHSTTDEHADVSEDTTVVELKPLDPQTLHAVVYVEEPPTNKHASAKKLKTARHATAIEQSAPIPNRKHTTTNIPYPRMGNVPLMLSPAKHKNAPPTEAPYIDVSEKNAHPYLSPIL